MHGQRQRRSAFPEATTTAAHRNAPLTLRHHHQQQPIQRARLPPLDPTQISNLLLRDCTKKANKGLGLWTVPSHLTTRRLDFISMILPLSERGALPTASRDRRVWRRVVRPSVSARSSAASCVLSAFGHTSHPILLCLSIGLVIAAVLA